MNACSCISPPASWSVLGLIPAYQSMSAENEMKGRDDQVISPVAWACLIQESMLGLLAWGVHGRTEPRCG